MAGPRRSWLSCLFLFLSFGFLESLQSFLSSCGGCRTRSSGLHAFSWLNPITGQEYSFPEARVAVLRWALARECRDLAAAFGLKGLLMFS